MVSLAFIISFVVSAVAMLIGISAYAEISDELGGVLSGGGVPTLSLDSPMFVCMADSNGDKIHELDKTTGGILSIAQQTIGQGCGGISQDPTTGIWYIASHFTFDNSHLRTVDPTTGIETEIGDTGIKIRSLSFDENGNLFAYKSQTSPPLYSIDLTTGLATQLCTPQGDTGKRHLSWNYDTHEMYSAVEVFGAPPDLLMVIDTNTCAESNIVSIIGTTDDIDGFGYNTADGLFYMATIGGFGIYTLAVDGTATLIGGGTFTYHGLAFTVSTILSGGSPPEEFAQAENIALTVLGVLPVALFFGLFTILSPRVDGGE